MELTEQQIDEVVALIKDDDTKTPRQVVSQWIRDSGFQGQIIAPAVMRQVRKSRMADMRVTMGPRVIQRITMTTVTDPNATVVECDVLIAAFQDALVTVHAKKEELSS